ncbi:MAG: hypothetical protein IV094_07005 [Vitreoscilla sp.]|nr:hypothetical protein [Vitreoscilla sp.]
MDMSRTLCRSDRLAKQLGRAWSPYAAIGIAGLLTLAPPVHAVDGCLVLLCFAAPSWRAIPQCVPPVVKVLRDLALGRAFPTCAMSGGGNTAGNQWSRPPTFCPPQYTHAVDDDHAVIYTCDYNGAVEVQIEGAPWTRTWWSFDGQTVTEYTPTAKASLGTWETKFDDDYAAWLAMQPPPPPPCEDCGG